MYYIIIKIDKNLIIGDIIEEFRWNCQIGKGGNREKLDKEVQGIREIKCAT